MKVQESLYIIHFDLCIANRSVQDRIWSRVCCLIKLTYTIGVYLYVGRGQVAKIETWNQSSAFEFGSCTEYGGGLSWMLSILAKERLRNFCLFLHTSWLSTNPFDSEGGGGGSDTLVIK